MNRNALVEMQTFFQNLDLQKIQNVYNGLADDPASLLKFINDPDTYMKEAVSIDILREGLHFHVRVDGVLWPEDISKPVDQLVFSAIIDVSETLKKDIMEAMRRPIPGEPNPFPNEPCSRCRRCAIAIINWV